EAELLRVEVREILEDQSERAVGKPEPRTQRRAVLIDGRGGNPAAARVGIVRAAEIELRELSVDLAALDRSSEDEMMAAPGVIAAAAGSRLERAAEIGFGEGRHVFGYAELLRCVIERRDRLAQLRVERVVGVDLVGVRVEAAERAEENLAVQLQLRTHGNNLRDLRAEARFREHRFQSRSAAQRRVESLGIGDAVA